MRGAGKKSIAWVGNWEGARDLCGAACGDGGAGIFLRKGLFLVTFFGPAKKVTPARGGHEIMVKKFSGIEADSH